QRAQCTVAAIGLQNLSTTAVEPRRPAWTPTAFHLSATRRSLPRTVSTLLTVLRLFVATGPSATCPNEAAGRVAAAPARSNRTAGVARAFLRIVGHDVDAFDKRIAEWPKGATGRGI